MVWRTYSSDAAQDPDLVAAATTAGVAVQAAAKFVNGLGPTARRGLEQWIEDPANDGAGIAEWRAAFPAKLGSATDAQVLFVMLFVAAKTAGIAVDEP